ncbi:MAG: S26 family signal peptidase [Elusimicrobiales bacterium]
MLKAAKLKGNSMKPFLKDGAFVFYKNTDYISRGDMVLYRYKDNLYLHRVIGFEEDFVIVSNDDDITPHKVEKSEIVGKVYSFFNGCVGYIAHIIIKRARRIRKILNEYFRKTLPYLF